MIKKSEPPLFFSSLQNMDLQYEWDTKIDPIVDRVVAYARDHHEKKIGFYSREESISIYTYLYDLTTTNRTTEYHHLEFFFQREMECAKRFCGSFHMDSIHEFILKEAAFTIVLKWFLCFFHHLNRLYLNAIGDRRSMETILRTTFRDEFMDRYRETLEDLLKTAWFNMRRSESHLPDPTLVCMTYKILQNDPDYKTRLENLFVMEAECYYIRCRHDWAFHGVYDYVLMVLAFLKKEETMIVEYLGNTIWQRARQCLLETLVLDRYDEVMMHPEHGWKAVLAAGKEEVIQDMSMFLDFSDEWRRVYREYLHEQDPGEGVLDLYETHHRYLSSGILRTEFPKRFYDILHSEIRLIFQNSVDLVERLVHIIDGLIRKKTPLHTIVRYLRTVDLCHDKNLFQEQYRTHLQNRLLEGIAHFGQESELIEALCQKMGVSYVIGMRCMLNQMRDSFLEEGDVRLSILSDVAFAGGHRLSSLAILPPSVRPSILRLQEQWSLQLDTKINFFPSAIHGQVVLEAIYDNSRYELQMNPLQASLLLWIQEKGPVSCKAFEELCGDRMCLEGLFHGMERRTLRRKNEVLWEIDPDFYSPHRRVRLPPLKLKKKTTLAASANMESNQIDTIIDAQIVRILKNLKTIQHQDLIGMLHQRLVRFQPSVACFKRRIESLIERDYIARCLPSNTYQYL